MRLSVRSPLLLGLFRGHDRQVPIPFGPYLSVAGFVAMMWGPQLLDAYMAATGLR